MSTMNDAGGRVYEFRLGDRLRAAREQAGHTVRDFEVLTGISRSSIGNYENGHTKPRRPQLVAWSMATGFDLEWLETGETPARPEGPDGGEVGTGHVRTGGWANPPVRSMALAA